MNHNFGKISWSKFWSIHSIKLLISNNISIVMIGYVISIISCNVWIKILIQISYQNCDPNIESNISFQNYINQMLQCSYHFFGIKIVSRNWFITRIKLLISYHATVTLVASNSFVQSNVLKFLFYSLWLQKSQKRFPAIL